MKTNRHIYRTLFFSTLYLSTFTFGGGYVIIPLMKKKFVDELNWMTEEEVLNFTAIAQSSPGARGGKRLDPGGLPGRRHSGALISILGTSLPAADHSVVISFFYAQFRSNAVVAQY